MKLEKTVFDRLNLISLIDFERGAEKIRVAKVAAYFFRKKSADLKDLAEKCAPFGLLRG